MKTFLIRSEEFEPLEIIPAPTFEAACALMRARYGNQVVHVVEITHWTYLAQLEALVEIISNCPVHS